MKETEATATIGPDVRAQRFARGGRLRVFRFGCRALRVSSGW